MSIWWQAYPPTTIKPVEIEKFSDKCVWRNGRRSARHSTYDCFFPTWEEAKKFLQEKADVKVDTYRRQLEYANGQASSVRGLKKPEGAA